MVSHPSGPGGIASDPAVTAAFAAARREISRATFPGSSS